MYTRGGVQVRFRPHSERYTERDGKLAAHPDTKSFFSESIIYAGEVTLREDAQKWEPCLKACKRFRASSLHEPCFDIYYHHREEGRAGRGVPEEMPYALVVSIRAPRVVDLYDQVVRAYAQVLRPLQPQTRIPIRA